MSWDLVPLCSETLKERFTNYRILLSWYAILGDEEKLSLFFMSKHGASCPWLGENVSKGGVGEKSFKIWLNIFLTW